MPHLTIEYSDQLTGFDAAAALLKFNRVLVASGEFEELDIKSRAIAFSSYLIGTQTHGRAFVHVKLALLSGRSAVIKQQLSEQLLQALQQASAWPPAIQVQLCVELIEIEPAFYCKIAITN
ncbi:5-carboxymethyl-2-hydroxymuconate Delta-isomerase [Undibacterium sp. Ren11W]|uniref:5-carboxymethyl-2-hydroxymuconate Delta-isomerase n=1 Tax=Undibacterium sp. Ren11W TaxID=3413045 RepID=UPI003BEFFC32